MLDRRRDPCVAGPERRERPAGAVVVAAVRSLSRQLERGITERAPERVLETRSGGRVAELDDQLADRRTREPALQEDRQERTRDRERREQAEPDPDHRRPGRERREDEHRREEEQREHAAE